MTHKSASMLFRTITLFCVYLVVVVSVGSIYLFPSPAESSRSAAPDLIGPQAQGRGFIGLPLVEKKPGNSSVIGIQTMPGGTQPVNINLIFAQPSGANPIVVSQQMDPESVTTILVGCVSPPCQLQARVSADQLLQAVSFEQDETGLDIYLGLDLTVPLRAQPAGDGAAATVIPLVEKDYRGWSTIITVQNSSDTVPATAAIDFNDQRGNLVYQHIAVIPANSSLPLNVAQISDRLLPLDFIGSAIVRLPSNQVAVASVRLYSDGLGLRSSYAAPSGLRVASLIAPALFKTSKERAPNAQVSYTSEFCVQSFAVASSQNVTVSYSDGTTHGSTIEPLGSRCFDQGSESHAEGWSGGAVVNGTGALAGVVNVTAYYNGITPIGLWSYPMPAKASIGHALALPRLANSASAAEGYTTSEIYLYNFNDAPALVTPRYVLYNPTGIPDLKRYCAAPLTIPAGGVRVLSSREELPANKVGSAYFTSTQPIAAAMSASSIRPIGVNDRNYGYGAAYPDGTIAPTAPCEPLPPANQMLEGDRR